MNGTSMKSKICLITGATSGIGKAAALSLARRGARLILVGRNENRGMAVVSKIKRICKEAAAVFYRMDLSVLDQVRSIGKTIQSNHPKIDVLINNAGARFDRFALTSEGNELTFATNHLGHFLLTALLWETMRGRDDGRIINVSSDAHAGARDFPVEKFTDPTFYNAKKAYAYAKLSNLFFTYELSRRLKPLNITVNALHPGLVATGFRRNNGLVSWLKHVTYALRHRKLLTPTQGARTVIYLASSPAVKGKSGAYFVNMTEQRSSQFSYDRTCMEKLWEVSCTLCGVEAGAYPV